MCQTTDRHARGIYVARMTSHGSCGNRLTFMISQGIDEADVWIDVSPKLGDLTREYIQWLGVFYRRF